MESDAGRAELQPSTLTDQHRCYNSPGRMDPVVTKAARNGSDPTKTAAGNVTVYTEFRSAKQMEVTSSRSVLVFRVRVQQRRWQIKRRG